MIDRKKFFDGVRKTIAGGKLTTPQVQGFTAILDEWEKRKLTDLCWLAYMFSTSWHETAHTMQPIAEIGKGRGRKYGKPVNGHVYYGRGFVQLTWDYNYKKMGTLLGVDLLNNPDLAMKPDIASAILFEGMIRGSFTGKKLADYFHGTVADWINARKIINGLDRAQLLAGYGKTFLKAINA